MLEIDIEKRLRDYDLLLKLDVGRGETLMLVGDNGCGKTTLLNLIAGLDRPDRGSVSLNGRALYNFELGIDVPPETRGIGYVFQSYALFPHMSVYDNVAFGLRARKMPAAEIDNRVKEHLEMAGLWEVRRARASDVSGGQKQRVALARALIIEPRLLLLHS
ncbi:MAG: ATP-binding cassette domain-containing protein [Methanothrix sp.]|nr:ATP-binding cassette domain-containing protein [Methanothrix sp.]